VGSFRKTPYDKNNHTRYDVSPYFNMISVPLTTLHRIYYAAPRNSIYLVCKDFRTVRVTLSGFESSKNKVETFVQVLQGMTYYNNHSLDPKTHLFAYKNLTYFRNNEQGWNLCDIIKEYARQGLFKEVPEWKVRGETQFCLYVARLFMFSLYLPLFMLDCWLLCHCHENLNYYCTNIFSVGA
jgi:hypothetical protein